MRAWQVHELGEPQDVLCWEDVPEPESHAGTLRLRVDAVALNFTDVLLCRGLYQERPPLPFTPGLQVCGTVLDGPHAGERVLDAPGLPRGGLAEQVVVAEAAALRIPDTMAAATAASMLINYQTGYLGLHRRGQLQAGETLLVHAGAGGVGSAAIQLGKAAGARVIATAGGPEKVQTCEQLGADLASYHAEDFAPVVNNVTEGRGVTSSTAAAGASPSRVGSSSSASPADGAPTPRRTMRWSRATPSSACTGASTAHITRRSSRTPTTPSWRCGSRGWWTRSSAPSCRWPRRRRRSPGSMTEARWAQSSCSPARDLTDRPGCRPCLLQRHRPALRRRRGGLGLPAGPGLVRDTSGLTRPRLEASVQRY